MQGHLGATRRRPKTHYRPYRRIDKMTLRLGDIAPDFEAETTQGPIRFHQWIGDGWAVLFSHPKDFTPVCTTELGYVAGLKPEFEKRRTKLLGLSVGQRRGPSALARRHRRDHRPQPRLTPWWGIPAWRSRSSTACWKPRATAMPAAAPRRTITTVRNVFVIGPDKRIKLMIVYPMSTGRNFDEILRVIDSLQLTAEHKVATPANWARGEDVIIIPAVNDEDARSLFPEGWRAPKPYMRYVKCPT